MMKQVVLIAALMVSMQARAEAPVAAPTEEQKNRECIAQFLQDAVKAIEYTALDAKNEEEQAAQFIQIQARLAKLEATKSSEFSAFATAGVAGVIGSIAATYLMKFLQRGGYVLGGN